MTAVTIIIPTLQNASGLLQICLNDVKKYAPDVEVIVQGKFARRTFAQNCNEAAAEASTPYLLFLNDDCEPHRGFLEPLVAVLNGDPDVAAVGSKLVYPDGRIQHAGVYLTDEHNRVDGHHYQDRRASGPVLAVTAASMLIRKTVFDDLGGFDESFRNGNEDVDLCLSMNAHGHKVWYCAESVVTHHESASGPERWTHVGENVALLSQRWTGRIPVLEVAHG